MPDPDEAAAATASPVAGIRPPPLLQLSDGNSCSLTEEWRLFKQKWQNYSVIAHVDKQPNSYQVALFLHTIGDAALKIYNGFVFTTADDARTVQEIITKFDDYAIGAVNLTYERFLFNQRIQKDGETFDHFLAALRTLIKTCSFCEQCVESLLMDRIVIGIRDAEIQKALLKESNLNLKNCISICKAMENAKTQGKMLRPAATVDRVTNSNKKKPFQKSTQPRTQSDKSAPRDKCFWCGKTPHPRIQCPAKDSLCRKCGKKGHWDSVCEGKPQQNPQKKRSANAIGEETDGLFLGSVIDSSVAAWTVRLYVNGQPINFRIDTGADVTVISKTTYHQFENPPRLAPCQLRLASPGGSLKTLGQFKAKLQHRGKVHLQTIVVIQGDYEALLGREAGCALGLVARIQAVLTGTMQTSPVNIRLRSGVAPLCVTSARKVPYPLRDAVKSELERMEKTGVIRSVTEPTDWCSPMVAVKKKSGDVRICVDLKHLNKAVCREHYTLPSLDDIAPKLKNSKLFSKLDAASGFWQIPLDESSQLLTTFMTPHGRFAFCRMPFGITSAPEIFQRKMVEILSGLDGVEVLMDDILIHGTDLAQHDERLKKCLHRLKEKGVHLNDAKCQYRKKSLCYFGCIISGDGIRPDPSKVQAIRDLPAPKDTAELRSVLGMIQYLGKFINISTVIKPLTELLQKNRVWFWGPAQENAFKSAKQLVCNAPTLAFYDHTKPTTVSADASSYGLGGVLLQLHDDGLKPVTFCSRTLTDAERRYSQIEKECLAAVWASEKFAVYLTGLPEYTLLTDHKPLVPLMSKKNIDECPVRCQRLLIRLMRFNPIPVYVKGKDQVIADALSRNPLALTDDDGDLSIEVDAYASSIQASWPASPARLQEIKLATSQDTTLALVQKFIVSDWPDYSSAIPTQVKPYYSHRDALSVIDGLITFENWIVIPESLRCDILERIHESHQGLSKCRERAAMSVWWPGISADMKTMVENCLVCRRHKPSHRELPLQPVPLPERPWVKLAADLCEIKKRRFIVVIDYYSRWLHIEELTTTTSVALIRCFKRLFANHGIPEVLVSDNGPQFSSTEFAEFSKLYGFTQVFTNPYRAQENGMAERAVQEAKKILAQADPQLALLNFRATPHSATGISPARALMGRELSTHSPCSAEY